MAPALRLAAPAVLILAVVAYGLHGETTLTFRELGMLLIGDADLRLGAALLWTLAMAPAARAAVTAPGLSYLRWLPVPMLLVPALWAGLLLVLALPPIVPLVVAGEGRAAVAVALAVAGMLGCLLPAGGRFDLALRFGGFFGASWLVWKGVWMGAALLGALAAIVRSWRSFAVGAESSHQRALPRLIFGPRWLAQLMAQALHLWRCEAAALSRALLVAALGSFLISRIAAANGGSASAGAVMVAVTPPLAAVAIMLGIVLKRARASLGWTSRVLGVERSAERRTSFLWLAVACAAVVAAGAFAGGTSPEDGWHLAVHALCWALLGLGIPARSQLDVRSASLALATAFFAMFAIGLFGVVGLGIQVGIALLVAGRPLVGEAPDA